VDAATYTNAALSAANTNPIVTDSAGRYVAYLPAGSNFTFAITTSAGAAIETQTNIQAVPGSSVNLDIEGTVGVAVTAGQVLYLSSAAESPALTAGKWYLTNSDAAATSTTPQSLGVAVSAIAINTAGTIRLAGEVNSAGTVVVGTTYYVGATPGAIVSSAPVLLRQVGVGLTTSSLLLAATTVVAASIPNPISQDLLFTDATYDIGKAGATRPRDGFFSRNAVVGGTLGVTGVATLSSQPVLSTLTASVAVFSDGSKGLVSNAITGTGNVVMSASPTLTTPALGTPSALVGTNITGTAAGLTAGNVSTNANLTGPITSVGNATSIAAQTGTGTTFVMQASPTLTTPVLGVATGTSLSLSGLYASTMGNNTLIFQSTTATTGYQYTEMSNTGGDARMGVEGTVTGQLATGSLAYAAIFGNAGAAATQFSTSNLARMTIATGGNVGIGTTAPALLFHAHGTIGGPASSGTAQTGIARFSQSGGTAVLDMGSDSVSAAAWFQNTDSANLALTYPIALNPNGGNVGIGTATPGARIDIVDSGWNTLRIGDNETNSTNKAGYFVGRHYTNAEENVALVKGSSTTSANVVDIGGNAAGLNAATEVSIWTAANNTTVTGTKALTVDASQDTTLAGRLIQTSADNSAWAATFANTGTTGANGVYVNIGSGATGIPFRVDKNGASQFEVQNNGNVVVAGALSKGSGSFLIDHPLPSKKDTHSLVHSFIEGPKADLIYRGTVTLSDGAATVDLDVAAGMTVGTWVLLCRDEQVFTSNETGWFHVRGSVSGSTLTIDCEESDCTDTVSWMVVAERQDQHMYDTQWTDENGRPIIEPLKPEVPDPEEDDDDEDPGE